MPGILSKASVTFEGAPLSRLRPEEIAMLTAQSGTISHIIRGRLQDCLLGILGAEDAMIQSGDLKAQYPNFSVSISKHKQSIRLDVSNTPANAFVDGNLTPLRKRHVAAAIRDLAYQAQHFNDAIDAESRSGLVEKMVADAGLLNKWEIKLNGNLTNTYQIVFQGGHTVGTEDFSYSKKVGEHFGLRGWEAITGSGPGTMRGPLRGNLKGFNQLLQTGRQTGFSSPEIIAAEPPNVYVTDLVILPDIEKRLEAFSRRMHGIVFLPGGIGTLEELLIQLGMKLDPRNEDQSWPIVLSSANEQFPHDINEFIEATLGTKAKEQYTTIINAPKSVAEYVDQKRPEIDLARDYNDDAHEWNRTLVIPNEFQEPFIPTHENMAALELTESQPPAQLAASIRKLCKGLVHGIITAEGRQQIDEHGRFKIHGDRKIIEAIDLLLSKFIVQKRIRTDGRPPSYEFIPS